MFQYFQLYFLILFPFFLLNVEAKFNDDDHPAPLRGDIDEEESQFFKFYTVSRENCQEKGMSCD